ncbi:MAG: hypothetical protein HYY25_11685 [Candidatus Wallbacteria bacterium]|nr:hypothetical protein [Candidatus Wallbacteria bacterium]
MIAGARPASGRWVVLALLALGIGAVAGVSRFRQEIVVPAERAVAEARRAAGEQDLLSPLVTETRPAEPVLPPGSWQLGCAGDVRAVLRWRGGWAMGTSAGLLLGGQAGQPPKLIGALAGLAASRVTALAEFGGALWLATEGGGLAAFDGSRLSSYRFGEPGLQRVTALAVAGEELFAGTFGGGVVRYDGTRFRRLRPAPGAIDVTRVSALSPLRTGLAVGTFDRGVLIIEGGRQISYGAPLDRVTALGTAGDDLLVGTPFALQRLEASGRASTDLPDVHVTAIMNAGGGDVLVGTFEGDVLRGPAGPRPAYRPWRKLPGAVSALACGGHGELAAGSAAGAFELSGREPRSLPRPGGLRRPHVSALALDAAGGLWIGYFDGGVERIEPGSTAPVAVAGLQSCPGVNHLKWDGRAGRMLVSTLHGWFAHDGRAVVRRLRSADGLAGENVSASLPVDGGMLFCTEKGVSVEKDGRIESIGVFHGLPNNHVYCAVEHQGRVVLGTLGGLAVLEQLRVTRSISVSAHGLPANWVSALLPLGSALLVGTYGGGCALWGPDGAFTRHPQRPGRFEVNSGALIEVGGRVAAGTLDRGVLFFPPAPDGGPLAGLLQGLGHPDVTALASDGSHLFIGTETGLTAVPVGALP